jgi:hypothetical protein
MKRMPDETGESSCQWFTVFPGSDDEKGRRSENLEEAKRNITQQLAKPKATSLPILLVGT